MTVLQQPLAVRGLPPAASLPLGVALAALLRFPLGPSNPVTPAGYVGYVKRGALFGRERFVALQTGPTSSGRGWLLRVINVSVTPYTYDEEFSGSETVLSCDSLKIAFGVHLVWRVRPERVRRFVENFSTLGSNDSSATIVAVAYRNFLRESLRTAARDEVQKYRGLELKDHIADIGTALTARVRGLTQDTPFEVRRIVVGNIQYPAEVVAAYRTNLRPRRSSSARTPSSRSRGARRRSASSRRRGSPRSRPSSASASPLRTCSTRLSRRSATRSIRPTTPSSTSGRRHGRAAGRQPEPRQPAGLRRRALTDAGPRGRRERLECRLHPDPRDPYAPNRQCLLHGRIARGAARMADATRLRGQLTARGARAVWRRRAAVPRIAGGSRGVEFT